jgi:hypothetical protein
MTLGILWSLAELLLAAPDLHWRAIIFDPAHQLIVAGAIIGLICLPAASDILGSSPEDLAIPDFNDSLRETDSAEDGSRLAQPGRDA